MNTIKEGKTPTVLYLRDSYITSLDQLLLLFQSKLSSGDPFCDEILTLLADGILEDWLNEGDDMCKEIAKKIKEIDITQTDDKVLNELKALFPKRKLDKDKHNYDYLSFLFLDGVICKINSKEMEMVNHGKYDLDSNSKNDVDLEITYLIDRPDKDLLELKLICNDDKMIYSGYLSTREKKIVIHVNFTEEEQQHLRLICNEREIFEIKYKIESEMTDDECLKFKGCDKDETISIDGVEFKMIHVKGGTFTMGAQENDALAYEEERPHTVALSDFSIGEMQVTQELWNAVMGSVPEDIKPKFVGSRRPVIWVSWYDCQRFIRKLNEKTCRNFRMPTEAEWEYAARGGNENCSFKYAGSDSPDEVAWYEKNSGKITHDVGGRKPNTLGLYDMSGNVYEWCSDWYSDQIGLYGDDETSIQHNPLGPPSGSNRVGHGGSWREIDRRCRVSYRGESVPEKKYVTLGLRLAI